MILKTEQGTLCYLVFLIGFLIEKEEGGIWSFSLGILYIYCYCFYYAWRNAEDFKGWLNSLKEGD